MGDTWTDEEVIEEILKYFSDIPTLAHTIMQTSANVCNVPGTCSDTKKCLQEVLDVYH